MVGPNDAIDNPWNGAPYMTDAESNEIDRVADAHARACRHHACKHWARNAVFSLSEIVGIYEQVAGFDAPSELTDCIAWMSKEFRLT